MTSSLSRCPVEDVLPWISGSKGAAILIADRVETSGRFLLFVTAAHAFRRTRRVLWLSCSGAYTVELIRQGLKKMACTLVGSEPSRLTQTSGMSTSSSFTDNTQRVTIRSIAPEFAEHVTKASNEINVETFVRKLYSDIQAWLQETGSEPCVVMLDDVSALADLVGPRLAYALVYQIRNSIAQVEEAQLLVRCAGDGVDTSSTEDEHEWIGSGVGGVSLSPPTRPSTVAWESSLVELVDWVVDVLPLQSGYSRDAHGRLLLTPRLATAQIPVRYNYCLTDQAVFAIRLTPKKQLG